MKDLMYRLTAVAATLAVLLMPVSLWAQAKKVPKLTKSVSLSEPWTKLSVAKGINVTVEMRSEYAARTLAGVPERQRAAKQKALKQVDCLVTAEASVAKAVLLEVKDGRLSIGVGEYKYKQSRRIDVHVLCDSTLREVHGQMGSNIFSKGVLRVGDLKVEAERAMEIHLSCVTGGTIRVEAHRQSIVWLTGGASLVSATLDGASFLRLKQMRAQRVNVSCSEESQAEVNATVALDLSASGKSEIRYWGPEGVTVTQQPDKSSRIDRRRILDNL